MRYPSLPDKHRDAFGRLVVTPESLSRAERIGCLRRLAGELQGAGSAEAAWLGRVLTTWLAEGGDLEQLLGVRPPRGSHARVERLTQRQLRDGMLRQLASELGGPVRAARVLQGAEPATAKTAKLVEELRVMRAPCSVSAFTRAASTSSRHAR